MTIISIRGVKEADRARATARSDDSGAQCIHRSFGIVRFLASSPPQGVKLTDIAAKLNLSHPTAHRILKALEKEGVVERVQGSRRYTVGCEAAWLGLAAVARFPITTVAAPLLDSLSRMIGDSVFLAVPSLNDSVYADRRIGSYPVQAVGLPIGARRPLGVSVAGRAMLAFMPERDVATVLQTNASRFAAYRCSPDMVLQGAREARQQGYLCADSVTAREKRVVSVPILDMVGAPVAAISVIASRSRLPNGRLAQLLPALRSATDEIARNLSHRARAA